MVSGCASSTKNISPEEIELIAENQYRLFKDQYIRNFVVDSWINCQLDDALKVWGQPDFIDKYYDSGGILGTGTDGEIYYWQVGQPIEPHQRGQSRLPFVKSWVWMVVSGDGVVVHSEFMTGRFQAVGSLRDKVAPNTKIPPIPPKPNIETFKRELRNPTIPMPGTPIPPPQRTPSN